MKALTGILACLVVFGLGAQAQTRNWREMISDPDVRFQDVQQAFYAEFGDSVGPKGSGWKQFKRWEWFIEQRLSENGDAADSRIIYEEVKRAALQKQYRGSNGDWQLIGPIEEPLNGQGESIGRISAVAFHPTDTNQIWAGAPSGGLWKSADNGLSWEPLTDDLLNIGIAEVVVNPHNPDTIYLASGDESASDTYTYGVMISTDGGSTWDTTGLSFAVSSKYNITRMLMDTAHTNVLIAATTNGIYRTEDAGVTWTQTRTGNFSDLEFKPFSSDTIYASTNSGSLPPFFISTDNGLTWTESTTGMNSNAMIRVKIAVSPVAPNVVYALASRSDEGMEGLYRSDDSGATWALITSTPNMMSGDEFGIEGGGQGWYSMDLAVSPFNEDEVRVGGINIWKSINGGTNFILDGHWFGANGVYVHADQHRLQYQPITGQFYAGCDGGLYRRSHYFNGYESISSGMSITQFYRLANAPSNPTIILAGAQDNGTFRWKNNQWLGVFGGDGMEAMIDPTNPNIMYCTIQNGELHRSDDGGNSFGDDIAPAQGAWVTPFMMEPGEPQVLYAASGSIVYRSDTGGSDWFEFSPSLTSGNNGPLILLDVAHTNTEYIVSGSKRTLRLTTDLGDTWNNIITGLPTNNLTYVAFDPLEENTIWVTFSGYTDGKKVYRSTNAGQTWENMSMNLPNLPVNCIEIERSSAGGVYVGTDVGVYYWDRNLTEWEPYMTGLPNVIVSELEIQESAQVIRAATFGRGLWESETRNFLNVGISEEQISASLEVKIWPNPASDFVEIQFKDSKTSKNLNLIDAYGRTIEQSLNPSQNSIIRIGIQQLASGVYYLTDMSNKPVGRFIVSGH
ncbi:MAG: T9SS type A sorting domain-containing protein [Flavobacteriales bacterium]|nr:T9SS type A sorting domain-containing protein [Flavobacteriales bacterium]